MTNKLTECSDHGEFAAANSPWAAGVAPWLEPKDSPPPHPNCRNPPGFR